MKRLLMGFSLAASMTATSAWACESDVDCKGDRICVDGACVDPAPAESAAPEGPSSPTGPTSPSSPTGPSSPTSSGASASSSTEPRATAGPGVSLFADIGGIIGYGLAAGMEFGGPTSGFVYLRTLYIGVAPHVIAALEGETLNPSSVSIGGGVRVFSNGREKRGFFIGGGLEYIHWSSDEDDADETERWYGATYTSEIIGAMAQAGYRWAFPSGNYMSLGGAVGYGGAISATHKFADGTEEEGDTGSQPVLIFNFELGTML